MTARWQRVALILAIAIALLPATIGAQSNRDLQVQQDLRILQEQIQQLRLAVAALAEQAKATTTKIDGQAEVARKNYADEALALGTMQTQVTALVEKLNLYAQSAGRFSAEIPAIRAGMDQQQKALEKLVSMFEAPAPTALMNASAGTPAAPGTPLPESPGAAFFQAKGFYAGNDYEFAAKTFEEFLRKFPDAAAFGGEANYLMGMSYYKLAKYPQALAAFTAVGENFKTSDSAGDALFWTGECYRAQGKKTEAIAAYTQTVKQFPDTAASLQAKRRLLEWNVVVK